MENWYFSAAASANDDIRQRAKARQAGLAKPAGSLGHLESLAIELAALQGSETPQLGAVYIAVFAADHGVAEEGVTALEADATVQMLRNFSAGGSAIAVMARGMRAKAVAVNMGTRQPLEALPNVLDRRIADGTANFCNGDAMTAEQFEDAIAVGAELIDNDDEKSLFIGGEMGAGNTTAAAALAVAHTKLSANAMTGPGAGLDQMALSKKTAVVTRALSRHLPKLTNPTEYLRRLGGFEIVALAGAYIRAAQRGIPVLVDGYIATAAAISAVTINPSVRPWLIFSHCSSEPGHARLLNKLNAEPLLQLQIGVGEGCGAALALPLLRAACALHNQMADRDKLDSQRPASKRFQPAPLAGN